MDFNSFIEAFSDLLADKVAERLKGNDWPAADKTEDVFVELVTSQPEKDEREEPISVPIVNHDWDNRRVQLGKTDVRSLRKLLNQAGAGAPEEFSSLSKQQVLDKAIDYEKLIGHTLEEEIEKRSAVPDDNDLSEPEAEDDDSVVELTREFALELDLPKLREIAAEQGKTEEDWAGLDVEAVVALIFGDDLPESEPEDDEDEGYTEEEIRAMSIAELKAIATQVQKEYGIAVEYDRNTDRDELANRIIKALS